ncbi:MAG: tripartite tricarboxylate transporter substrate binding protein [Alphaproteobacteria bacterium]|nr:tripartite tricarboxylate transporter substrate binding protein [Alphaproteobacteria bacterium]
MAISRRQSLVTLSALAAAPLGAPLLVRRARAQGATAQPRYPVAQVALVSHSSPGGGSDVMAREMLRYLPAIMGVTMVVENVTGGSSARAITRVATAPTDGSVLYVTTPTYINTSLLSRPPHGYDTLDAVVNMFFDPQYLFVRAGSPYRSVADLIAAGRAAGARQRWGATTPGGLERQTMEQLRRATGVNATVVTHDGGGDQLINVLNGSLEVGIGEMQELGGQVEARKVRLLAVLTPQRVAVTPDVPTGKEQGIDLVAEKFRGLAGPKGMAAEAVKAWEAAIPRLLAEPGFKTWYERGALVPAFQPQAEAQAARDRFVAEQRAFFAQFNIAPARR